MRIRILAALSRRGTRLGVMVAVALLVVSAVAIHARQAQPTKRVFTADAALMYNVVKPDKTADFEAVIAKVKEALQKSSNEARKQQAASWKVFKQVEPGPNGTVLYIFLFDPVVKETDYTPGMILYEADSTTAQALFKTYSDSYAGGVSSTNLQLVNDFSK